MKQFLKKHKRAFITVVIVLCFAMMIAAGINRVNSRFFGNTLGYAVIPIERAFEGTRRWAKGIGEYFATLRNLTAEVEQLRADNDRLQSENNRYTTVDGDNRRLARLLRLAEEFPQFELMAAEIISRDPGNWFNVYHVNKGSNHGVRVNMMVIAEWGLAGRVTEVYNTYSKIVSLIDDTSSIAARTYRRNDHDHVFGTGYVMGDTFLMMDGLCKMERIPEEADVKVGDIVVTGHLSTIFAPNILIGEIAEVWRNTDGSQSAIVKPAVDFSDMEAILIVMEEFDNEFARDGD
jgi:rod shape-determining protein MreC